MPLTPLTPLEKSRGRLIAPGLGFSKLLRQPSLTWRTAAVSWTIVFPSFLLIDDLEIRDGAEFLDQSCHVPFEAEFDKKLIDCSVSTFQSADYPVVDAHGFSGENQMTMRSWSEEMRV